MIIKLTKEEVQEAITLYCSEYNGLSMKNELFTENDISLLDFEDHDTLSVEFTKKEVDNA